MIDYEGLKNIVPEHIKVFELSPIKPDAQRGCGAPEIHLGRVVASKSQALKSQTGVCVVLVAWILHAIFAGEAETPSSLMAETGQTRWENRSARAGPSARPAVANDFRRGHWLAAGLVDIHGATIPIGVVRWRIVLDVQGLHLRLAVQPASRWWPTFSPSFSSTGGDLLKAYFAAGETSHRGAEAVTTVVVDRLLGLFAMLLFSR